MNGERIIELVEAKPFRPFVLVLGFEMDSLIDDPKLASVHEDSRTPILHEHRAESRERWERWIDLNSVSAVIVKNSLKA